jgi:hypothetical protein
MNLFRFFKPKPKPIFIIGSGRSGTHLLARTFKHRADSTLIMEDKRVFKSVSHYASGYNRNTIQMSDVVNSYSKILATVKTSFLVDKAHPNIWLCESLMAAYPQAKFIGIHRGILATVNSMLQHPDIMLWYERLDLHTENPFLGITANNVNQFAKWPVEVQCACRVISHKLELDRLQKKYPKTIYVVEYNHFYSHQDETLNKLSAFLQLKTPLQMEPLHADGLDKWKTELQPEQIERLIQFAKVQGVEDYLY